MGFMVFNIVPIKNLKTVVKPAPERKELLNLMNSVRPPPRNKHFRLFNKDQIRKPTKIKVLPLVYILNFTLLRPINQHVHHQQSCDPEAVGGKQRKMQALPPLQLLSYGPSAWAPNLGPILYQLCTIYKINKLPPSADSILLMIKTLEDINTKIFQPPRT